MNRVRLSGDAKRDLQAIWRFIAVERQNPANADRQIDAINDKLSFLARSPLMGELRNDLLPELRAFVADSYVIFYDPLPHGIVVQRVVHGSRDIDRLFK